MTVMDSLVTELLLKRCAWIALELHVCLLHEHDNELRQIGSMIDAERNMMCECNACELCMRE